MSGFFLPGMFQNQMEDEYGELYAQKVEERLLHYLLRLEAVLPGDTCVDKVMKNQLKPFLLILCFRDTQLVQCKVVLL